MNPPSLMTQALISSLKPEAKEYAIRDAQCPGLSIRVLPTGKMSWTVRTKQSGTWQRITLGAVAKLPLIDARAKAFVLLAGEEVLSKPDAPNAITFSKLAEIFLKAKDGVYKPDTIYCLKIYLNTQLLPAFGQTPINKLKTPKVAEWFHSYSRDRPGGANQAIGHLTTMLNFAKDQGHLAHSAPNPCAPIRRNRRKARGRRLRLTSKDPNVAPDIDLGLFENPEDVDTLVAALKRLRVLMAKADFGPHRAPEVYPGPDVSTDDQLRQHIKNRGATAYHPVGTLRMGTGNAPVTPRLSVKGTTNLWVADASIMPAVTSANTNAPAMMIGYKAAKFISEDAA